MTTTDTTTDPPTEQPDRDPYLYAWGLFAASVCTSLDDNAVTEWLNRELPTGCSFPWAIDPAPTFSGGEPHPWSKDRPARIVVLTQTGREAAAARGVAA